MLVRYECIRCKLELDTQVEQGMPVETQYIGETSRTAFTRHNWHQTKYTTGAKCRLTQSHDDDSQPNGSFMWIQFTESLTQQVDEDIRLRESGWGLDDDVWIGCGKTGPRCVLLHSQGDYYKPKLIRTQFRKM
jgi:hypothetical protein